MFLREQFLQGSMASLPLLLVATLICGGTASLTISPDHVHWREGETTVTVRCVADTAITRCQVKLWYDHAVDLSLGHASNVSGYRYHGDGLEAGHCGATIDIIYLNYRTVIVCRTRTDGSDWQYAYMSVAYPGHSHIPMTTKSRLVLTPPGGDVDLLYQAQPPLTDCQFYHPSYDWVSLADLKACGTERGSNCYFGRGLSQGDCGVTLRNITANYRGYIWFQLYTTTTLDDYNVITLIVTKPPSTPVLTANTTSHEDGTTTVRAQCKVDGGIPAANISWVLGGSVVQGGKIVIVDDDIWVDQWEPRNITQQLTLTLDPNPRSQELWCIAHHVAVLGPLPSNKIRLVLKTPEELRQLSQMDELHRIRLEIEADNAKAARDNAKAAMDNAKAAAIRLLIEEQNLLAATDNATAATDNAKAAAIRLLIEEQNLLAATDNATATMDNTKAARDNAKAATDNAKAAAIRLRIEEQNLLAARNNATAATDNVQAARDNAKAATDNAKIAAIRLRIEKQNLLAAKDNAYAAAALRRRIEEELWPPNNATAAVMVDGTDKANVT